MSPTSKSAVGLDIGSNTFSCVELKKDGDTIKVVDDSSIPVRLSEGLTEDGLLKPIPVARALFALEQIAKRFDAQNKKIRTIGTAVLRMSKNPEIFTAPASKIIGSPIETISGEEEALLVGRSAAFGIDLVGPTTSLDIGGQSTEICHVDLSGVADPRSIPLGVVSLTSSHIQSDPPTFNDLAVLKQTASKAIQGVLDSRPVGTLIAVAGTATTLGKIELRLTEWERDKVHGLEMSRQRLIEWIDRIASMPTQDRIDKLRVPPMRADVFPAGLLVLDLILEFFERDSFVISANGLRYGVALDMLED